jgi:hypothetical protein
MTQQNDEPVPHRADDPSCVSGATADPGSLAEAALAALNDVLRHFERCVATNCGKGFLVHDGRPPGWDYDRRTQGGVSGVSAWFTDSKTGKKVPAADLKKVRYEVDPASTWQCVVATFEAHRPILRQYATARLTDNYIREARKIKADCSEPIILSRFGCRTANSHHALLQWIICGVMACFDPDCPEAKAIESLALPCFESDAGEAEKIESLNEFLSDCGNDEDDSLDYLRVELPRLLQLERILAEDVVHSLAVVVPPPAATAPGDNAGTEVNHTTEADDAVADHVSANGYVEYPSDRSVYILISKAVDRAAEKGVELTLNRAAKIVESFGQYRVRWTRPLKRDGNRNLNSRLVHEKDWIWYLHQVLEGDFEVNKLTVEGAFPKQTREEQRQAEQSMKPSYFDPNPE